MLVHIRAPIRVGMDLRLQTVDIPELRRRGMGVEQIVYAQRSAPAGVECVVDIEV